VLWPMCDGGSNEKEQGRGGQRSDGTLEKHIWSRSAVVGTRVRSTSSNKRIIFFFLQKRSPNCKFYGRPPFWSSCNLTGESDVRGKAGSNWMRKVFNCLRSRSGARVAYVGTLCASLPRYAQLLCAFGRRLSSHAHAAAPPAGLDSGQPPPPTASSPVPHMGSCNCVLTDGVRSPAVPLTPVPPCLTPARPPAHLCGPSASRRRPCPRLCTYL
jgi:hypothetical protein